MSSAKSRIRHVCNNYYTAQPAKKQSQFLKTLIFVNCHWFFLAEYGKIDTWLLWENTAATGQIGITVSGSPSAQLTI